MPLFSSSRKSQRTLHGGDVEGSRLLFCGKERRKAETNIKEGEGENSFPKKVLLSPLAWNMLNLVFDGLKQSAYMANLQGDTRC